MADKKLTELDATTTASTDDLIYIVDDPSGTPVSKKITVGDFLNTIAGQIILLQEVFS